MAVLETQDLTYIYSQGSPFEKIAVDHVNIKIEEGEMVGVMGHTGSGKSTLIQHFNGLLKPTSGKIMIDGQDIWADKTKIRDVRFKVGLVFQYPEYQIFEETVYKDIAFGPKNMGLDDVEIKKRDLRSDCRRRGNQAVARRSRRTRQLAFQVSDKPHATLRTAWRTGY